MKILEIIRSIFGSNKNIKVNNSIDKNKTKVNEIKIDNNKGDVHINNGRIDKEQ